MDADVVPIIHLSSQSLCWSQSRALHKGLWLWRSHLEQSWNHYSTIKIVGRDFSFSYHMHRFQVCSARGLSHNDLHVLRPMLHLALDWYKFSIPCHSWNKMAGCVCALNPTCFFYFLIRILKMQVHKHKLQTAKKSIFIFSGSWISAAP